MTDNVRKIFDMLGVEPNEKFKVESDATNTIYYITEDLKFVGINESGKFNYDDCFRLLLTNKIGYIIKLPKEPKKKKLKDWTEEDYKKWKDKNCKIVSMCDKCIFKNVVCAEFYSESWVNNKDLYSDKFLNQEIEVEE